MRKIILALFMAATVSFAELINGVALTVNDEPITLYDIEKTKQQYNIPREDAVAQLIDETLFNQLIKEHNITVDLFDVNNYLEKIAASNGMDLYQFKSVIKQKYKDYDAYEKQTKNMILRQKLTDKLVRGNIKIATEEDLKIYYENNSNMFTMATNVKAVQYSSTNRQSLESAMRNPMVALPDVNSSPIDLDQRNLNPQLRYMINETNNNQFTPIFTAGDQYVTLMILQKQNLQTIAFEDVRDRIFNIIMQDREQKYLKDYFEKLKLSADIRIVR
ncbi:peptidyl-prolyl cis-trans isomerase [Campylobacterota bacterium DY0563]|uniref:peptidyl-prolyl cis-trans isomerase n=1 Tax=Halarcobacter sp. TaxID=2321133 RepID=UPI0029F53E0A|nr:peptidyl-prolyl cis-trans isomerase [Halarcobacter sp.]